MKINQKGNDYFETPDFVFKQLDKVFKFELDVACTKENTKCREYIPESVDSLLYNWSVRCFCNPPFSKKAEFIKKADEQVENEICPICVIILPINSMDTRAWHKHIEGKYYYEILEGRISFIDPETKKPKRGNNSGTVIVYFKKKIKTYQEAPS